MSDLAQTVRPRYHVAGTRNTFWARPPYRNKDLGAGAHVTRFISLGSVDNPGKQKWLHALGMVPAAAMDLATLHLQPEVRFRVVQACDRLWLPDAAPCAARSQVWDRRWLHDAVPCAAQSKVAYHGHLQIQVICSCRLGSCHPEQWQRRRQAEAPPPAATLAGRPCRPAPRQGAVLGQHMLTHDPAPRIAVQLWMTRWCGAVASPGMSRLHRAGDDTLPIRSPGAAEEAAAGAAGRGRPRLALAEQQEAKCDSAPMSPTRCGPPLVWCPSASHLLLQQWDDLSPVHFTCSGQSRALPE